MKSDIVLRTLTTVEELGQVEELQRSIWPGSEIEIVPLHLIKTIALNGGIVLGAFEGEELRGYVFGFMGLTELVEGRPASEGLKHCSHQLGVHPDHRNRGIGYLLKLAQRVSVIEQGIRLATWTYDPLLSLNAHLNVRRLGVVCSRYIPDAYGSMRDGLNVGLPSDRFDVDWYINSDRVVDLLEKGVHPLELDDYLEQGAECINPSWIDERGLVHPPDRISTLQTPMALVEIPSDFMKLKDADFELAREWRALTCGIFETAFEADYLVMDFLFVKRGAESRSYYLLKHREIVEGLR
jgi:predicted GNAT superfamily acetyltransferase